MNLNCTIQLLRYNDDSLSSNNVKIASPVLPNNIDVSNTTKKSTRITKKNTFKDKSVIGDFDDQSGNIKKKKCMTNKPQSSKNNSKKSVTTQKDTKKTKSQKCASKKLTKNNSTNSDNSKVPHSTITINCYKDCGSTNFMLNSLKTKKKTSKSITSIKKKSILNNVNKEDTLDLIEKIDKFAPSKTSKNKSSKSSPCIKIKNVHKNDKSNKSDDLIFSRKRGRSTLKKVQSQKTDINIYNNDINSQKNKNWSIVLDSLNNTREPQLSKNVDDNTVMLRSNNEPPKIKKKWSDEWSGNKLLNLLKPNNDFKSDKKIHTKNCSKLIKKGVKNRKPKNANHKKLKTKMLEKLNTNIDDSLVTNDSNTCNTAETIDKSTTHITETQSHDSILITNSIPVEQEIIDNNTTELIDIQIHSNDPCNTATTSSSEVTTVPCTEIPKSVFSYENDQPNHLRTFEPISNSSNLSIPVMNSECPGISYGISILSEAISRQCNELANKNNEIKPEHNINEKKYSPKKTKISPRLQVPSTVVSPQKIRKDMSEKLVIYASELCEIKKELQSHMEHEILILSKRFNIPIDSLKKTVEEEPLSVFKNQYFRSISRHMVKISPIINNIKTKSNLNINYISRNLNVEYKLEPMREGAAYEKTNLKDLMEELTKTMPSWNLSIVSNPLRYVISHMSIDTYGIPTANKSIVLDKYFRASVYINQCLKYTYCKQYSTATEIINLIKELNSL